VVLSATVKRSSPLVQLVTSQSIATAKLVTVKFVTSERW